MDAFWKWLMRANARGVFLGAVLGLVVVAAWWTWKELAPVGGKMPVTQTPGKAPEEVHIGLLAYLDEQLALGVNSPEANPFLPERPSPSRPTQVTTPGTTPATAGTTPDRPTTTPGPTPAVTPATQVAAAQQDPPVTPPGPGGPPKGPGPQPKPETVSLTYRGIFKRPDGVSVALIEDSKTKSSAFYLAGGDVQGVTIGDIGKQDVAIIQSDGEAVTLHIGEPAVFEGGVHVD